MKGQRKMLTGSGLEASGRLPAPASEKVKHVMERAAVRAPSPKAAMAPPEPPEAEGGGSALPPEPAPAPPAPVTKLSGLMAQAGEPLQLSVDSLDPSPYQPRMLFDEEGLQNLANSMLTGGQIQPIAVRKREDGRYEIIAGERRWRAAQLAGMPYVLSVVLTLNDEQAAMAAISENAARENLSAYEFGKACHALLQLKNPDTEKPVVRSVSALARHIGVSRSTLDRCLDFMKLPEGVLEILDVHPDLFGATLAEQMVQLADKVAPAALIEAAEAIRDRGVSEQYAAAHLKALASGSAVTPAPVSHISWPGTNASIKARVSGRRIILTCDPGISPTEVLERMGRTLADTGPSPAAGDPATS